MAKRSVIALILIVFLLSACSAASRNSPIPAAPPAQSTAAAASNASRESETAYGSGKTADNVTSQAADRLVIRDATLTIVVDDPFKTLDVISQMANDMRGFVVSSRTYQVSLDEGGEAPEASVTVRVPAERLDEALQQIKQQVKDPKKDVLTENVNGQDVTKDYTDLKSRLTNLEQAEAQLREIMASATRPEDVLNIFNQLTSVREQIEVLKGQIQYYEESAAMSAVSVTIRATDAVKPLTIGGWQPVGVARDALQATISTLKFLVNAAIWLVIYVLPIGIILYAFWRLVWFVFKRIRKPKTPRPLAPPSVTPPAA